MARHAHAATVIAATTVGPIERRQVVKASARLTIVDGLWRQLSVDSGRHYWSTDGNYWHATRAAALAGGAS